MQEKIKTAMAKKPTAAMLNNRGLPVEQLNKIVTGQTEKNVKTQRVVRNANKKLAMTGGRPLKAHRTPPDYNLKSEPARLPNTMLMPVPTWFTPKEKPIVSIIIPLFRSVSVLTDQIEKWASDEDIPVEIIYVDDKCPDNSKSAILKAWKKKGEQPVGKIVLCEENVGYARACNVGALNASGEYLIFLNSDTVVEPNWIKPMLDLFKDPKVGMVGNMHLKLGGEYHGTIDSAGSQWNWHSMHFEHVGRHIYQGKHLTKPMTLKDAPKDVLSVGEREMVTGCCFMMRKSVFEEVGMFDPRYRVGYWEDSDLCMKVKEEGYKIMFTPESVIWHKVSHSGAAGHKYYRNNMDLFRHRWINNGRFDKLLFTPRPGGGPHVRRILIKRFGANGDVLMASGLLPALKKKFHGCHITFLTACVQVLHGNPHVDRIVHLERDLAGSQFDVVINLDLAYEYYPQWSIMKAFAKEAGVPLKDCRPNMATKVLQLQNHLPSSYVVMHAKDEKGFGWVGRNWKPERFIEIAERLREAGHFVICVGTNGDLQVPCDLDVRGKTNMQELATIMKGAKYFIGQDSMPMHLAQVFDIPGLAFFGSVMPSVILWNDCIKPIRAESLECLGCHARQKPPSVGTHVCARGDSACESMVTVEEFWNQVLELTKKKKSLPVVK